MKDPFTLTLSSIAILDYFTRHIHKHTYDDILIVCSFMECIMTFLRSLLARFQGQTRRMQVIISAAALVGLCTCCGIASAVTAPKSDTSTTASLQGYPTATQAPTRATATAKPKATATPQTTHYPPVTKADLDALVVQGDASAIHEFHAEAVGLVGVCPEAKREVTVDPSVTGKQLAEDLLAYFYGQSLDNPCGSLVLAYVNQSDADTVGYYTAGRINMDVTDANGQGNIDPNATNLTYTLTLDVGGLGSGQDYSVSY